MLGALAARVAARLIGPAQVVARLGLEAVVDPAAPYFWKPVDGRLVPEELALAARELHCPGAGQLVHPLGPVRALAQRPRASAPDEDWALFEVRLAYDALGGLARIERKDIVGDGPSCELHLRDGEGRLIERLERASPRRAPLAHSHFRYDASGRPIAQSGVRQGVRFEVQLTYDAWEGNATELVRVEGRERGRRVHELDAAGRVLSTRQLNEQGHARRIASYEYAPDASLELHYDYERGTRALRLRKTRSADSATRTIEHYDAGGRCLSSSRCVHKPDAIESVCARRSSMRTECGRTRERTIETHMQLRPSDRRALHGLVRTTDLETGESEEQPERYAYDDDRAGNWIQRERAVQLPNGDWRVVEGHTRGLAYRN